MMILRKMKKVECVPISNQKELVVKGLLIRNEYELRTYVRFTH